MLVLDTDVVSIYQGSGLSGERLRRRVSDDGRPFGTTVVTLIEQFRGRLAACHRATDPDAFLAEALRFRKTLRFFRGWQILDFDAAAAHKFRQLKAAKIRIGTMDLRIAAIVLANDATLVTRNLTHFRQVPGLRAEDWTAS